MTATVKTFSFLGIKAVPVNVQVKISQLYGPQNFVIVGLPDKAVGESKERVRSAILSTGISWPYEKITVNLAPADLPKEGSHFDLAIALGIMIEMGILEQSLIENLFSLGELSLDGTVNQANGIISAAITANEKNCGLICPEINGSEAAWANNPEIIAAPDLLTLLNHLKGKQLLSQPQVVESNQKRSQIFPDLSEVKGQKLAKRALEIAACGAHNLLMIGPPGAGKSMLSSRLPGILPPLEIREILDLNMIHSVGGHLKDGELITDRPYRNPHHSCSIPAMVGGGAKAKPGEISLAHHGVLFLDELAEFPRSVLDSLRQPIEEKNVSISRANSRITYPANFQLIAAMNPCRCGHLGDSEKECKKAPICGENYKNKISGPILDRIDIIINVKQVNLFSKQVESCESSSQILQRVVKARKIQQKRYENHNINTNSQVNGKLLEKFCHLDDEEQSILEKTANKLQISARKINRILKVSRTIADLDNSTKINSHHLLEAISYTKSQL